MSQVVVSKGIFHGLPTFPEYEGRKLTAIVTGANGISGSAMVKVLSEAPERWDKVYALSRRAPDYSREGNIIPLAVDFLESTPEEIAKVFQDDFIYFASYVQAPPAKGQGLWSDSKAMTDLNLKLLANFLEALSLAEISPKRVLLQTGAKYYGLHLGPTATPMEENDPRHGIEPNFYFPQEDLLYEFCGKSGSSWVVTRPCFILGATETAAMNILYPLSVYAAVQAHLGRNLEFPGDVSAWDSEKHQSTATLIAYHAEWALLNSDVSNIALNHSDGSVFSWGKFWPTLAGWYGIQAQHPPADPAAYNTVSMPYEVPPRGFGGPGIIRSTFTFLEWSRNSEVIQAWGELKLINKLRGSPFGEKALDTFGLLDAEILGYWGRVVSMDRSRKLGWHGFVDTKDAIRDVIEQMVSLKLVPPFTNK